MWSALVIATTPLLDDNCGLVQSGKDLGIQAFLAKCCVETFATAILPGLARFDVGQFDASLVNLVSQRLSEQFAAVIAANSPGHAVAGDEFA